ncbi:MAG: hypothetical protein ETSY1_34865 [Candidatus Entotheonella factor]|uniref:Aminotransferase DegT n=1 Tax=Entotheonella factor TaxID=1429438 RepID=W4LAT7_ENTF1|nr:MAG: hypothetical protein ETSY1_34865 [Candidatus Entotheonella factor]
MLGDYLQLDPYNLVAVNSCTSAITLVLHLSGVTAGDEVITTPMTCTATNEPILHTGARLRWADVDLDTGNIDPSSILPLINERTKAIVAVHWGGIPCDLDTLSEIAEKHDCVLIEDAAHALGASYHERPIGHHGHFVCFSFQAVKLITTGDGGVLACREPMVAQRARRLRWYGIDRDRRAEFGEDYPIDELGFKFHMNDIAAAIGISAMPHLSELLEHRAQIATLYDTELSSCEGIHLLSRAQHLTSANWLYTLRVERRNDFRRALAEAGIETSPVHQRNDQYTAFPPLEPDYPLPGLEAFTQQMVCIPIGHWVTLEDAERIVSVIREGW